MMWRNILLASVLGFILAAPVSAAGLDSRVNEAFRSVFRRNPTGSENTYWLGRVVRGEKTTFAALQGAMFYHKTLGQTTGGISGPAVNGSTSLKSSDDPKQLIVNVLPLFVQIYGNDPTNTEKAWWRKRISCGELTTHKDLVSSMMYHKSKKARKGSDGICAGSSSSTSNSSAGIGKKGIAGISSHPFGDEVRIGIFSTDGRAIHITGNKDFQVREGTSKVLATVSADKTVQVSWSDGKYHVRGAGLSFDVSSEVRLVPLEGGIMEITSYNDKSTTIAGKNYNRFRGIIAIHKCDGCSELWAINQLRTEYYLRGLAETSGTGPEEYIKALGIAARTYVLYHKVVTGGRNPARGYDIGRTSDDQVYRGYEYELITPRMASIFNQSKGIIAIDGSEDTPVTTVYFSDSDGRTRSAKEAWGTDRFPHLQHSVTDPHHVASSCHGHCVGMSAQGAFGFAKADGWSFQKILKYYFKGIRLVKAY